MIHTKSNAKRESSNVIYYGLLIYTVLFYSQIAQRYPVLTPLRIEFITGSLLIAICFIKFLKGDIEFKENGFNSAALFFFCAAFITIPFAYVRSLALFTFINLLKFFSIYLMIITTIDTEQKLKGFIYLYLAMIALLFVQPFVLSLQGEGFIYNNGMMRLAGVTGYFGHPNALGSITAANLPFFYFMMKYEKSILRKLLFFLLMIMAIRVIMLTQSRTAFLGVITFFSVIWLMSSKKIISAVIILTLCLVTWSFTPSETKNRFSTLSAITDIMTHDNFEFNNSERERFGSMGSRWILIKRSLIVFAENPILGVGLDCFKSVNGRRWGLWFPPHSTYIQALVEMGILGFIAFFSVITVIFKNLLKATQFINTGTFHNNFLKTIVRATFAFLIVRLIVSMFGIELYANDWWLAGGLSVVILRILKQDNCLRTAIKKPEFINNI